MKPVILRAGLAALALVLAQSFAFGQQFTPPDQPGRQVESAAPASGAAA